MKRFQIGQELSLLAVDAAYEIDTVATGSSLNTANELGQRLSELETRLMVPYGDVEASVAMRKVFNGLGHKVDTIEELRKCLREVALSLTGNIETISAKKPQLVRFCIAIANMPVAKRVSALMPA